MIALGTQSFVYALLFYVWILSSSTAVPTTGVEHGTLCPASDHARESSSLYWNSTTTTTTAITYAFIHIPKSSGTSFCNAVLIPAAQRNNLIIAKHPEYFPDTMTTTTTTTTITTVKAKNVLLCGMHFSYLQTIGHLHPWLPPKLSFVVMLRHPIDRYISWYEVDWDHTGYKQSHPLICVALNDSNSKCDTRRFNHAVAFLKSSPDKPQVLPLSQYLSESISNLPSFDVIAFMECPFVTLQQLKMTYAVDVHPQKLVGVVNRLNVHAERQIRHPRDLPHGTQDLAMLHSMLQWDLALFEASKQLVICKSDRLNLTPQQKQRVLTAGRAWDLR